ncbi:hypothetical protein GGI21_000722, partial [Coemansia aciculifera]
MNEMELHDCRLSEEPAEAETSSQRPLQIADDRISSVDTNGAGLAVNRDMDVDSAGDSGDENMGAENMDDVADGFIGDFEEIDEDDEVQRYISSNLTPAASTQQSPTALRPQSDMNDVYEGQADESSDDEDDSFESITERESGRLVSAQIEPEISQSQPMEADGSTAAKPVADGGLFSKVSGTHMQRLRSLEDEFRKKHVPKLESDRLFFNPEVYKRYTVLAKPASPAAEVAMAPTSPETLAPPPPTQQKRSSLRAGGDVATLLVEHSGSAVSGSGVVAATNDSGLTANDLPVSSRTRHATSAQEDDDVVGAILGVMSSPKSRASNVSIQPAAPKVAAAAAPTPTMASIPHAIPNDMLVAMMAIEGVDNAEVTSKLAAARISADSATSKDVVGRLPKGYTGPFSQLASSEHRQFLELVQRMKAGMAPSTKDNADYQRLKPKVEADQQAFRAQARERAMPLLKAISDDVTIATLGELASIGAEALKSYPPTYMPVRVTAIRSSSTGYVPLVYKDTLLQRGVCYHAEAPELSGKVTVPVLSQGDGSGERRSKVMSRDAVAMDLAARTGADVAISASALIALLTLPQSYNHEVIIPFRVVESAAAQGDDLPDSTGRDPPPRRMVVVDKPLLPPHTVTPRKLNQMHYEAAVRRQFVDRRRSLELAGGSLAKVPELAALTAKQPEGKEDETGLDNANYTLW